MKLSLVAFGKLKTPGLREAADYYRGLVRTLVSIEEIELKPIPVPDKSASMRRKIQEKEGEILLTRIQPLLAKGRVGLYLLDETGKAQPTQGWAAWVRSCEEEGLTDGVICVGSSLGFSATVREKSRGVLSLGPQTLSHELARVVLLEQLYRAWGVTRGHPYHNEGT